MTTQLPSASDATTPTLYEQDYYSWLETTINQLQYRRFDEVDLKNLLEELEDMGRSQKKAVQSNGTILLMHLLKYKYQPQKRSRSWRSSIVEHRRRLIVQLEDSPSLKRYFQDIFGKCYQDACRDAATETGLPYDTFPTDSPFTPEDTLDPDYLPE